MREWIDVRDDMPKEDELILVIVSGKPCKNITLDNAYELARRAADGWMLETWPEAEDIAVTYRTPLPEPPGEDCE